MPPTDGFYHNFRPSKSVDCPTLCGSNTPIDGFWGSENVKSSVGKAFAAAMVYQICLTNGVPALLRRAARRTLSQSLSLQICWSTFPNDITLPRRILRIWYCKKVGQAACFYLTEGCIKSRYLILVIVSTGTIFKFFSIDLWRWNSAFSSCRSCRKSYRHSHQW